MKLKRSEKWLLISPLLVIITVPFSLAVQQIWQRYELDELDHALRTTASDGASNCGTIVLDTFTEQTQREEREQANINSAIERHVQQAYRASKPFYVRVFKRSMNYGSLFHEPIEWTGGYVGLPDGRLVELDRNGGWSSVETGNEAIQTLTHLND
jgi:hypothetical protein